MTTVWFMKGFANLFNAINDIKVADINKDFKVLCSHSNPNFIGFEAADFFEVEPQVEDDNFLAFVLSTIKKHNVKVIYAASKQVLLYKNKEKIKKAGATLVTAASDILIPIINDKAKLYEYLKDNNVLAIPEYSVFTNQEQFISQYEQMKDKYPVVCMKPVEGIYGIGFFVLKEKNNDLFSLMNQQYQVSKEKYSSMIEGQEIKPMMIMQYLEGAERSVDCVAYEGQLIGATIRKKSSGTLPQLIEDNPVLIEQVRWLVKYLNLNGMFNVQFKDSNGKHYLLEINPRLSGRSFYATVAGLNIPYIASLIFSGKTAPNDIKFDLKSNFYIQAITTPVIVSAPVDDSIEPEPESY